MHTRGFVWRSINQNAHTQSFAQGAPPGRTDDEWRLIIECLQVYYIPLGCIGTDPYNVRGRARNGACCAPHCPLIESISARLWLNAGKG